MHSAASIVTLPDFNHGQGELKENCIRLIFGARDGPEDGGTLVKADIQRHFTLWTADRVTYRGLPEVRRPGKQFLDLVHTGTPIARSVLGR